MDNERNWIEAARGNDAQAFAHLVQAYQRPVYSLAYRMLGNPGDAEDASQEAFLKAYRALGSYDAGRPFSTWLLSITAHHCIDRLRRRRMVEVSLDGLPSWRWGPVDTVDPQKAAEQSDQADRMQRLLAELPEDYRLMIVLRYWHDLSYEEIAEITDQTVSAVKSRLHRARRQLAAYLAVDTDHPQGRSSGAGRRAAEAAAVPGGINACTATMPAS
jgi:RNA polymerase sigma-70 factor (ECF subfamily)